MIGKSVIHRNVRKILGDDRIDQFLAKDIVQITDMRDVFARRSLACSVFDVKSTIEEPSLVQALRFFELAT